MLVLNRRPDEKIQIGSSITITVVRIRGRQVQLGIEAPAEVSISRPEASNGRETDHQRGEKNGYDN